MIDTVEGYVALIEVWRGQAQPVFNDFVQYMIEAGHYEAINEQGYHIPSKQAVTMINAKLKTAGTSQVVNNEINHSGRTVLDSQINKDVGRVL